MGLCALSLLVLVVAEGVIARRRRYRLLWHNPDQLTEPDRPLWGLSGICKVGGSLLMLLVASNTLWAMLLSHDDCALAYLWPSLAALAGAIALFMSLARFWSVTVAFVSVWLLTFTFVNLVLTLISPGHAAIGNLSYNQLTTVLLTIVLLTAFWSWLAGVWDQQLDDAKPWTTAGRLCCLMPRIVATKGWGACIVLAVIAVGPVAVSVSNDSDRSLARIVYTGIVYAMLVWLLLNAYRRWGKLQLIVLLATVIACGLLYAAIRLFGSTV